ncbi:MAG: ATP-binding protein [Pyrinomonadaceae bacterium]
MTEPKKTPKRYDPYKNFKFRVAHIVPTATRDDIRLPERELALLDQIVETGRNVASDGARVGATALFVGEKGTGKSTAGEVVANQLGLDVYRVDLSEVVSKYIGETEKNLERVFARAGEMKVVLYLDEADALFGKRSEVKDSHDRYATTEIDYLLQKIEAYNGLVILATNRKKDIDEAFLRRLPFVVHFPSDEKD